MTEIGINFTTLLELVGVRTHFCGLTLVIEICQKGLIYIRVFLFLFFIS